jgi:hypothetical protein
MSRRRSLSLVILVHALLLAATSLQAGTWVKSVQSCEPCVVERGKAKLQLLPLMALRKGDQLSVAGEGVRVVLVDSADRQITMDDKRPRYTVTEASASLHYPPAMVDALEWFRRAASQLQPGGRMLASGDRAPAMISSMDADSNQIPAGEQQVVFAWDFGQPPFTVTVLDRDGKILIEKQTDKQKLAMPLDSLGVGNYRFQLASTYNGEKSTDSYPFSIVDASALPGEIAYLDTVDIPPSIRTLLRGVLLARYPQWRFMALQQAIRVKDRPLARVLLEEESH